MTLSELLPGVRTYELRGRGIVVGDGAMATYLHQLGVSIHTSPESLNITDPQLVKRVHDAYCDAGATVLQTNTFSAHRRSLERLGLEKSLVDINQQGVFAARESAKGRASVFGTIGSIVGARAFGARMDTDVRTMLVENFREQAEILLSSGVDGILLETFPDFEELELALRTVRGLTNLPVVANLAPEEAGVTRDGVLLDTAFRALQQEGATVVGLNCKLGPSGILRSVERLEAQRQDVVLAAVPNAGMLYRRSDDEIAFTGSDDYFASTALRLIELGVQWVGGCCGTTPATIQAFVDKLRSNAPTVAFPRRARSNSTSTVSIAEPETNALGTFTGPTLMERVKNETTVIVELDPPKTLDCERYLEGARALTAAGADFITLADNSLSTVRVSNMALASRLKNEGINPLVHVTCRDRNLIGQQSHLMGLHVLGINHILLVTGDPSKYGELPGSTSVYDVSSIELTKMVENLNRGIAFSGKPLKSKANFSIGTSFNPHVRNFDRAIARLERKVEAGAQYVMTQPIFDEEMLDRLYRAVENWHVPMFVGVMPLVSARNAYFLHNEVPGIDIPEPVLQAMIESDPDEAAALGLKFANQMVNHVLDRFRGIYLVTPFLRYEMTVELTKTAKARETVDALL